jgi:hypothetical protein
MKTFRVKAVQIYYWAGRDHAPGEIFDVDEAERGQFQFLHDHIPGVIEMLPDEPEKKVTVAVEHTTEFPREQILHPEPELAPQVKQASNINPATGKRYYRRKTE